MRFRRQGTGVPEGLREALPAGEAQQVIGERGRKRATDGQRPDRRGGGEHLPPAGPSHQGEGNSHGCRKRQAEAQARRPQPLDGRSGACLRHRLSLLKTASGISRMTRMMRRQKPGR